MNILKKRVFENNVENIYLKSVLDRREVIIVADILEKNYAWIQGSSRGMLYSFLSAVIKDEISMEQIKEFIKIENVARLKKSFALLSEEKAAPLLNCISNFAATWENRFGEDETESEILELRKEFAYLFLTPKGVYPFESVYLGRKNLLMDKPWEEVRNFYRQIGLEKDKNEKHPEDHAAVELGLMAGFAFLSGKELPDSPLAEITEEEFNYALQVQRVFLEEHLLKWIPSLCDDIREKTRHYFYSSAAELTRLFVEADGEMLRALKPEDK
jgi:TorA maturation chaperone TorD